jgi:hypothetical protein
MQRTMQRTREVGDERAGAPRRGGEQEQRPVGGVEDEQEQEAAQGQVREREREVKAAEAERSEGGEGTGG